MAANHGNLNGHPMLYVKSVHIKILRIFLQPVYKNIPSRLTSLQLTIIRFDTHYAIRYAALPLISVVFASYSDQPSARTYNGSSGADVQCPRP